MSAFTVLGSIFYSGGFVYIRRMTRGRKVKASLFFTLASFLAIFLFIGLTSPVNKIGYALVFFGLLFIFLVSLGHFYIYLTRGQLGPRSRGRIVIFSVFVVLILMFSSSQSLNWVDGLILVLVLAGLLFYSSRRA